MTHLWRPGLLLLISIAGLVIGSSWADEVDDEKTYKPKPTSSGKKPNVVIILIDDMGFNDVSFHGSNQFLTPNIDALAYNGIILNKNYVPNLCTPSRASLMTGKYHIRTGMQHMVIVNDEPWGLPLEELLMSEIFQDAGYSTNLVGKWHLGFYRKEMTPTFRGFDHHYGYYSGYIGYNDHTLKMLNRNYSGLDFRNDLRPMPELNSSYATDLFTQEAERIIKRHDTRKPLFLVMSHLAVHTGNEDNPMEAPQEEIEKFAHITNPKRRVYAAMMSRLDHSVGRTIKALGDKKMLDNTIVLLYSDNGAPTVGIHANSGSNHPFRGQKESPWEGGIRTAGLIWSPLLKQKNYVSNQVTHAIDWLPTLAAVAGILLPNNTQIDGINLWPSLNKAAEPQPRNILHVLDDVFGYSSYTKGNMKYINGSSWEGKYDNWLGGIAEHEADPLANFYVQEVLSSTVHNTLGNQQLSIDLVNRLRAQATASCPINDEDYQKDIYKCEPFKAPCLFDIEKDPCERYNLASLRPLEVQQLAKEVDEYRQVARPPVRIPQGDPLSNPIRFGGNWQWWYRTDNTNTGNSLTSNITMLWSQIIVAMKVLLDKVKLDK